MTQTMKAAVVHAFGEPLRLEEVKVPMPGPGQILVKIAASGVCHTDLHAAEGDWPVKPSLPFIPGHEGVGHVAAVGAGVTRVKEGDRVGVPWLYTACGCCEHCLTGWETSAKASRTPATRSMAATPNTCWPTRTTLASCRRTSSSTRSRRFSAPVSLSTRASRSPVHAPASGW